MVLSLIETDKEAAERKQTNIEVMGRTNEHSTQVISLIKCADLYISHIKVGDLSQLSTGIARYPPHHGLKNNIHIL